jgi:hypothetical protein
MPKALMNALLERARSLLVGDEDLSEFIYMLQEFD